MYKAKRGQLKTCSNGSIKPNDIQTDVAYTHSTIMQFNPTTSNYILILSENNKMNIYEFKQFLNNSKNLCGASEKCLHCVQE